VFVLSPPALGLLNLPEAFRTSDPVGQGITLLLLVYSIWVWTCLGTRWSALRRADRETWRFLQSYQQEAHPLQLHLRNLQFGDSPLYQVYHPACERLTAALNQGQRVDPLFKTHPEALDRVLSPTQLEAVHKVVESQVLVQALKIQEKMSTIATAINLAPFLGLFGTVWGVMDSFSTMAVTGAPTLKEIAPGVTSALLTTVAGLFVAIPATFGHHFLTEYLRQILVNLDNFAGLFNVDLKHHYAPRGAGS
jgi:biopolymer transport protein TolQ